MRGKVTRRTLAAASAFLCFTVVALADPGTSWRVDEEQSPVDDSPSVHLRLPSDSSFTDQFGNEKWGMIQISCVENRTMFLIWAGGQFLTDTDQFGLVTVRVDKAKADRIEMRATADNRFLGVMGAPAIDLIKEIAKGRHLFVRLAPFRESQLDMAFSVQDLSSHLPKVKEACSWGGN